MMTSHAVTAFSAPLLRTEQALPRPQGTQVLLRTLAAGVCHSDIHIWQGGYDLGHGKRLEMAQRGVSLPLTLGHEIVGEVVALGPDGPPAQPGAGGVQIGQRLLVYPWVGCGHCAVCQRGREHLCAQPAFLGVFRDGGYSSHVLVPHPRYLIDIGNMAPAQAAPYACSGLTAFSAIHKVDAQVLADSPVVVIGAGGVGLMAVSLLGQLAGRAPVVIEPDAGRRAAAIDAGASATFAPDAPDALAAVRAACGGAVWAVIDCVGAGSTVQLGLDLLTKGGQLIQVGLFGGDVTVPTPLVPMRAISWVGSYIGSLGELQALWALVGQPAPGRRLRPVPVSCRCIDQADAALRDLAHGRVVGRVVLTPDGQG